MVRTIVIMGMVVIGVCYVVYQATKSRATSNAPVVAIFVGIAAFVVVLIAGIVGAIAGLNDDERAINTYLRQQGYHVSDLDYKSKKGWHNSYWQADVYREADPACGGTIRLKRDGDRTVIISGLSC